MNRSSGRATATATTIGTALALQGTAVVSGSIAAHLLGVTDRGNLALLWIVALITVQLGSLGTPAAVTYGLANRGGLNHSDWLGLRRLACAQAGLVVTAHAIALLVVLHDRSSSVQTAGAITLIVGAGGVAQLYGLAILQGAERFLAFNVLRTLPLLAYSLALVAALLADAGTLVEVATIWAIPTAVFGCVTLAIAVRRLPRALAEPPLGTRSFVSFGVRAIFGTFAAFEQLQLDQALVALLLSTDALGVYVAAVAISNLPRYLGTSIGAVAFPAVAACHDLPSVRREILRFALLGLAVCGSVVAGLAATLGSIVPLLFGDEFRPAIEIGRILLLASLLQSLRRVLTDATRGADRPGLGTIGEMVTWATMVPTAVALGSSYGLKGIAWALATASAAGLLTVLAGLGPVLRSHARR